MRIRHRHIRNLREDLGLSREAFCEPLKLSTDALQKLERGLIGDPKLSTICAIAQGFTAAGRPTNWRELLTDDDEEADPEPDKSGADQEQERVPA